MKRELKKMKEISADINVARRILKENEAVNKSIRRRITAMWGDRTQDEAVAELGQRLRAGKQVVKSCQSMIASLKWMHRNVNRRYDVSREVRVEQPVMA